jgi:hypothetical protein
MEELGTRLTAGDRSVSPAPTATAPSAFFGLTQAKALYLYSEVFDLKPTSRLSDAQSWPEKPGSYVQLFDATNG